MIIKKEIINKLLLTLTVGMIFSACNDNSADCCAVQGTDHTHNHIGKLIDSAVEGVEYRCGEKVGVTDENGTFSCVTLPISFHIGAIELGSINLLPSDGQVFPQDIVGVDRKKDVNHSKVVNLALLLQSLDSDKNASNGIQISETLKDKYLEPIVLSELNLDELKEEMLKQDENIIFKDIDKVVEHLSFSVGLTPENNSTENNTTVPNNNSSENNITVPDNNNSEENVIVPDNNGTENNTSIPDNNSTENNTTVPDNNNTETTLPKDIVVPVITLLGDATVELIQGTVYSDAGATASDDIDGDITSSIVVNNSVDVNTVGAYSITYDVNDSSENEATQVSRMVTVIMAPDTTAPTTPTLTITPSTTNSDSTSVEVQGEANADVYLNDIKVGTLSSEGSLTLTLDTSGDDGAKNFAITIKDSSGNSSTALSFEVDKDTTPPATNSTINALSTDDTTPALSGSLPQGDDDTDTSNYTVSIEINDVSYEATNNEDGSWSLADDTVAPLPEGFFTVIITVTDEAENTSSTTVVNKIEINNTAFLIDSAIEGIKYTSGSYSGYTDINGLFKYEKGSAVSFYIGDEATGIPMGSVEVKTDPHNAKRRIVTLFDLAGSTDENNPKVLNMGKFLQSLDVDKDISNGITIDERSKESIALLGLKEKLDFNQEVEAFHENGEVYNLFNDLADHFGEHRGLVRTDDAQAHLLAVRDNTLATKSFLEAVKVRGEKQVVKVLTGVFKTTAGVVEGLEYRCGNQFGRTTSNGEFLYEEGKKIKFYIYQLELGITEANAVLSPANLVASTSFEHPRPRNIIRLLSAFDAISSDGKVTIDNAVREALEKYRSQIDLNLQDGKANAELNIPAGVDEFGTQFEDFEMGSEILDEIERLRGDN